MGRRMMKVVPLPGALDHLDRAPVLIDDDVVGDGQALARAFADFLGGEERLEDALLDVRRHAGARVADLDDGPFAVGARLHADLALALAAVADHVLIACAAFTTMLSTTWLNSAGEQCTDGRLASRSISTSATYFHSLLATVMVLWIARFRSVAVFSRAGCENSFMARTILATRSTPSSDWLSARGISSLR